VTGHLGVLLDWTVADLAFLGIAIQQYISVSRDLKRTKAKEAAEKAANAPGAENNTKVL
jgi:hypothetical protein